MQFLPLKQSLEKFKRKKKLIQKNLNGKIQNSGENKMDFIGHYIYRFSFISDLAWHELLRLKLLIKSLIRLVCGGHI